ncbi:MAG: protein phosphatase 2C domain-containing protein [Clostridiales bacterium]|nr:protein phosphatase 2C domain-containing protein [Clostridiales bacterium]
MNKYDAVAFTSAGGQPPNEDAVLLIQDENRLVAILADGLGAYCGGEIASTEVVEALGQIFPHPEPINRQAISACFTAANRAVIAQQKPGLKMRSTAVMLILEEGNTAFAHIGDSRGYAFRDGHIIFQTIDHSVSQMAVFRGDITADQIRFHKSRSQLIRALGVNDGLLEEITKLDVFLAGDAFLLCSDGFWEYITEEEMVEDLLKSQSAEVWLNLMLDRIESRTPEDNDNLSAIVVICD